MTFGQPYIQDESGQIIGNALTNIGQTIANAMLRKREMARENVLFGIAHPGWHLLAPGQQAPEDDQTLNVQGSPQIQQTPTAFQKGINDALNQGTTPKPAPTSGSVTRASMPLVREPGAYFDPNEYRQIVMPQLQLSGLGSFFKGMYGAAGKLAGDPGLLDLRQSQEHYYTQRGNAEEALANRKPTPIIKQDASGQYIAISPVTLQPTPTGVQGPVKGAASRNAEPPAHRDAREAFDAVSKQISDNTQQIGRLTQQLRTGAPDEFSTPADSAAYNTRTAPIRAQLQTLQQRGDSLSAVRDRLGATLTGATGVSTAPTRTTTPPLGLRGTGAPSGTPTGGQINPEIARAQQQLNAILGNPNVPDAVKQQARAAYTQRLQRIQGGAH